MERKKDNLSLKEVLQQFVSTNNLQKGMDKVDTAKAWSSLMGPGVNKYTSSVELKGNTLYVSLTSSVLREVSVRTSSMRR